MTANSRNKMKKAKPQFMRSYLFFFIVAIFSFLFAFLLGSGCVKQESGIRMYNFDSAFDRVIDMDSRYGTSFLNESTTRPLEKERISGMLKELGIMRRNNEMMNISSDYHAIGLLLDSRKSLLMSQAAYRNFSAVFIGRGKCLDAPKDMEGLQYLDKAVDYGISANSRFDKLLTESEDARRRYFGLGVRASFYETDYGALQRKSRLYKEYLAEECNVSVSESEIIN